ncbi:hypothetical protein V8D89_009595 [Ganoderma adspersum]
MNTKSPIVSPLSPGCLVSRPARSLVRRCCSFIFWPLKLCNCNPHQLYHSSYLPPSFCGEQHPPRPLAAYSSSWDGRLRIPLSNSCSQTFRRVSAAQKTRCAAARPLPPPPSRALCSTVPLSGCRSSFKFMRCAPPYPPLQFLLPNFSPSLRSPEDAMRRSPTPPSTTISSIVQHGALVGLSLVVQVHAMRASISPSPIPAPKLFAEPPQPRRRDALQPDPFLHHHLKQCTAQGPLGSTAQQVQGALRERSGAQQRCLSTTCHGSLHYFCIPTHRTLWSLFSNYPCPPLPTSIFSLRAPLVAMLVIDVFTLSEYVHWFPL